jgi:hypothetical protein
MAGTEPKAARAGARAIARAGVEVTCYNEILLFQGESWRGCSVTKPIELKRFPLIMATYSGTITERAGRGVSDPFPALATMVTRIRSKAAMTIPYPTTPGVRYESISRFSGYCFGDDGSVWTRYIRGGSKATNGSLSSRWRKMRPVLQVRTGNQPRRLCERYRILLSISGVRKSYYVHRLILEAFKGPCPAGMVCCHNNGDATDNRPQNLRWDTHKANVADKIRHGTAAVTSGSRHGNAKLTEDDIPILRNLHAQGWSFKQIGEKLGIHRDTVRNIVSGKRWGHVPVLDRT